MPPTQTRRRFLALALATPFGWPLAINTLFGTDQPSATAKPISELDSLLSSYREKHKLPAVAAGVMRSGALIAAGAVGVRKWGESAPVTIQDKFHIGSNTKAMTATLAALLVEQQKIQWESTLAGVFPERAERMHAAYRKVTLAELLTHRSGAPANGNQYGSANQSLTEQRLAYLDAIVAQPPGSEPGTTYLYSNASYIMAGAMLERSTGQLWEDLMRRMIFKPLHMDSAGFGPPAHGNEVDQPWGHRVYEGKIVPLNRDNPRALGPAGTVHCSIGDYLKFADLHVSCGERPGSILPKAAFDRLHEPPPKQEYAFGWAVVERNWAKGRALNHNGSNTMNFFTAWLAPKLDLAFAIATNAAGEKTAQIMDEIAGALVRRFARS